MSYYRPTIDCDNVLDGGFMTSRGILTIALGCAAATIAFGQAPAGQRQGPGVQATQDPRYAAVIAKCKNPPAAARGPAPPAAPAAAQPAGPREYKVTAI